MAGAGLPGGPAPSRNEPVPLRSAAAALIGWPRPVHLHTAGPFAEPLPRPPRLRFTCAAELPALGAPAASCPPPRRSRQPGPAPRPPGALVLPSRLLRVNRLQPSVAWIRWKEDNEPDLCVCVCVCARAWLATLHCNIASGEATETPWNRDRKKKKKISEIYLGSLAFSSFSFSVAPQLSEGFQAGKVPADLQEAPSEIPGTRCHVPRSCAPPESRNGRGAPGTVEPAWKRRILFCCVLLPPPPSPPAHALSQTHAVSLPLEHTRTPQSLGSGSPLC